MPHISSILSVSTVFRAAVILVCPIISIADGVQCFLRALYEFVFSNETFHYAVFMLTKQSLPMDVSVIDRSCSDALAQTKIILSPASSPQLVHFCFP